MFVAPAERQDVVEILDGLGEVLSQVAGNLLGVRQTELPTRVAGQGSGDGAGVDLGTQRSR